MATTPDVQLAQYTTLGLGGPARSFTRVTNVGELHEALRTDERVLILGGGSNLVVSDAGFPGLVIHMGITGTTIRMHEDYAVVSAFAGEPWDDFVAAMISHDLAGLECLSGIPGLVGATPMQNVGAYGQEVADTIVLVRVLDRTTGEIESFEPAACNFAYRTSIFKGSDRWVVIEVRFKLRRSNQSSPIKYPELAKALGVADGDTAPLARVRETVIALRRGKGMVVDPADPESKSAGSFFMNPLVDASVVAKLDEQFPNMPRWPQPDGKVKLSAGWLIERSGFAKGHTVGRVGISKKHALALVNRGGATTAELLELARTIQAAVRDRLGVEIVPEPVVV